MADSPTEPTRPSPQVPPAGPPPGPTTPSPATTAPRPPPAGARPPSGPRGGGIPVPLFIVSAVVTIVAVVLAIVFFLGKSSADDDKKQAQDETEQVRAELGDARAQVTELEEEVAGLEESLNSLEEELGTSEEAGQILAELVTSGQAAADQLFACAQSSREFIINFFDTGTPDEGQARTADDQCAAAEDAYNTFNDALAGIEA